MGRSLLPCNTDQHDSQPDGAFGRSAPVTARTGFKPNDAFWRIHSVQSPLPNAAPATSITAGAASVTVRKGCSPFQQGRGRDLLRLQAGCSYDPAIAFDLALEFCSEFFRRIDDDLGAGVGELFA